MLGITLAFRGSSFTLALAAVLTGLPLLQLFLHLFCRRALSASVEAPVSGSKNREIDLALSVKNSAPLPLRARVKLELKNSLTGESCVMYRLVLLPLRGQRQVSLPFQSRLCGAVTVKTMSLSLTDVFSLISIPCRCGALGRVTVQPDTFCQSVHIDQDANSPEDSPVYSDHKPGWDMSEPFRLREYMAGDSLRQIHWKLSRKLDQLIVREPSLPVTRSVIVLWERRTDSRDGDLQDMQAEVVVSLCRALLEQSVQFTLAWNEENAGICPMAELRDMDDLVGVLPRILAAGAVRAGDSAAALFCRMAGESGFSHLVYVTDAIGGGVAQLQQLCRLTVLLACDGDAGAVNALTFHRDNYTEVLTELVI